MTTTCARPGCTAPADTYTRGYCEADYRRRIRMGLHGLVDPAPVLEHLADLRSLGWTWEQIGHAAGTSPHMPRDLHHGIYRRLRRESADALLAVPLAPAASRRGRDSTGTRRRVQALAWMGWPAREIARRAGCPVSTLRTLILPGRRISYDLAARVARVYEQLHMTPGLSRGAAGKARGMGFAPPLAWDPDTIDDPDARPDLGERVPRRVSVVEDAQELLGLGYTDEVVAARLGVQVPSVKKYMSEQRRAVA